MALQHASIQDPDIHEPKGVAAAADGTIYVADGAGSGDWTGKNTLFATPAYGIMAETVNATATSIPTANTYVQVAGTYTAGVLQGMTFASNSLTVTDDGIYLATFAFQATQSTGTTEDYLLTVGINGTAQALGAAAVDLTSGQITSGTYQGILTLSAGDVIYPMITNITNDNKGATVVNATMSLVLLRNT